MPACNHHCENRWQREKVATLITQLHYIESRETTLQHSSTHSHFPWSVIHFPSRAISALPPNWHSWQAQKIATEVVFNSAMHSLFLPFHHSAMNLNIRESWTRGLGRYTHAFCIISVYTLAFVLKADILSTQCNKDDVMLHVWRFWEIPRQ